VTIGEDLQRGFLRLHQAIYVETGGRVGHRLIGVPSLILRTTGRRSGRPRTAVLTYARDGSDFVLVASNGGQDRPPAWLVNVRANPVVQVQVGRSSWEARGRVVEPEHPDYARLWQRVNDNNHGRYEGYQARTDRPIALLVVTPSGPVG
jgi:F420H(2)-dependent quinone reductase